MKHQRRWYLYGILGTLRSTLPPMCEVARAPEFSPATQALATRASEAISEVHKAIADDLATTTATSWPEPTVETPNADDFIAELDLDLGDLL